MVSKERSQQSSGIYTTYYTSNVDFILKSHSISPTETTPLGIKTDATDVSEQIHSTVASEDEKLPSNKTNNEEVSSDEQNNDADISDAETIVPTPAKGLPFETSPSATIFTCGDCGRTFNRIGNLRRHESVKHAKTASAAGVNKRRTRRKSKVSDNADGVFGCGDENKSQ